MSSDLMSTIGTPHFRGDSDHVTRTTDLRYLGSGSISSIPYAVTIQLDNRQYYDLVVPEGKTATSIICVNNTEIDDCVGEDILADQYVGAFIGISKHFISPVVEFVVPVLSATGLFMVNVICDIMDHIKDHLPTIRFLFDDVPPIVILSPRYYDAEDYSHVAILCNDMHEVDYYDENDDTEDTDDGDSDNEKEDNDADEKSAKISLINVHGKYVKPEHYGRVLEIIVSSGVESMAKLINRGVNPIRMVVFGNVHFDAKKCTRLANIQYLDIEEESDYEDTPFEDISSQIDDIFINNPHLDRLDIVRAAGGRKVSILSDATKIALSEGKLQIDNLTVGPTQDEDAKVRCGNLTVMYSRKPLTAIIDNTQCSSLTLHRSRGRSYKSITSAYVNKYMERMSARSSDENIPTLKHLRIVDPSDSCTHMPKRTLDYGGYSPTNSLNDVCAPVPVDIYYPVEHARWYTGSFVSIM